MISKPCQTSTETQFDVKVQSEPSLITHLHHRNINESHRGTVFNRLKKHNLLDRQKIQKKKKGV